jgi:hypothetical protein
MVTMVSINRNAANVFGAVNSLSSQIMVTGRISMKFVMVGFGKVRLS